MNRLFLLILVLVSFCYFGGKYCPKFLKDKKEMLLGVFVGITICSFADIKLEGFANASLCKVQCRDGIYKMDEVDDQVARPDNAMFSPGTGYNTVETTCDSDYPTIVPFPENDNKCLLPQSAMNPVTINLDTGGGE